MNRDRATLIPVPGAWVRDRERERFGRVRGHLPANPHPEMVVEWLPGREVERVSLARLACGLQLGMDVQDVPRSRVRRSLGEGEVVELREIGGREQALVDFPAPGIRAWLPYENLRQIRGVRHRFLRPPAVPPGEAERLRLRLLAHALELWNENTGSLSHLDIDPLPHQIHLVHRILASGNLNWLIADDVGLGKTIEVGMLLAALEQRGGFRRVLIVTPAGLTRQWRDELHAKFGMDDYLIYGVDFRVHEPRHWKLYDRVIASVDLLKLDETRAVLRAAEPWDLVIFDEAHRLSRRQWGRRLEATDRFRLAAELRERTDSLLLLTATPHQGMQDKFQALLELLRPELKAEIDSLDLHPEILRDMVIRNHKAEVTDAEGRFIFKGKIARSIEVTLGAEAHEFERALRQYLRLGYAAGRRLGRQGLAIGFVMTVYRKLAASSAAAILRALERRLARLHDEITQEDYPDEAPDERYQGEWEEAFAGSRREFFEGELEMLTPLIEGARRLARHDRKIEAFVEGVVANVLDSSADEKILVFTEYRATQEELARVLGERFGSNRVNVIHGSQAPSERINEIAAFEDSGQFLISTEAGGEGINLQRRCHVMVNFDLPWNPMRLVQRIGRLYRYGQPHQVVVFNVQAAQTLDAEIVDLMYRRIDAVVHDLAVLGGEFNPGLADEILGELADVLDVEGILEAALGTGVARTREQVEAALERAREAVAKQRELFEHVTGFDPEIARRELAITGAHVRGFVEGMFSRLGIETTGVRHGGLVLDIRLPEELLADLPWSRTRLAVTLDRTWGAARPDIHMLDLASPLMQLMLARAKAHAFGGLASGIARLPHHSLVAAVLRWQSEQGRRLRQELAVVGLDEAGRSRINSPEIAEWLADRAADGEGHLPEEEATRLLAAAEQALDRRLAEVCNTDLHPENRQLVAAGWRGREGKRASVPNR